MCASLLSLLPLQHEDGWMDGVLSFSDTSFAFCLSFFDKIIRCNLSCVVIQLKLFLPNFKRPVKAYISLCIDFIPTLFLI